MPDNNRQVFNSLEEFVGINRVLFMAVRRAGVKERYY